MSEFLSFEDIEQLEKEAERLFQQNAFGACERILRRLIVERPLKSAYFGHLGRVHECLGAPEAAQVAFRRERQLQIIEANTKTSPAVDRLEALWASRLDEDSVCSIDGFDFAKKRLGESDLAYALERVSICGKALLQICAGTEQEALFARETEILVKLSNSRCQTSPEVLSKGLRDFPDDLIDSTGLLPYRIVSYLRADRGGFGFGDLIFALLEQQAMGVYVNNLSLDNIRYDSIAALLRFSDYTNMIDLSEELRCLTPRDFLEWCKERERDRMCLNPRHSFLLGSCQNQEWVWDGSRLKAAAIQIVHRQQQASLPEASIQSVETQALTFRGAIDWAAKAEALDRLNFAGGERVLEVGCGMGEGVRYLAGRGCVVTGVETDTKLLCAGQMISNIDQDRAVFLEHDFDFDSLDGEWDTVMLLSVLHHFYHLEAAAKRIAASCRRRIVIESACNETGYKWIGPWYQRKPAWDYQTEARFVIFLESVFSGFVLLGEPLQSAHGRKLFTLMREEGRGE